MTATQKLADKALKAEEAITRKARDQFRYAMMKHASTIVDELCRENFEGSTLRELVQKMNALLED
jgi:tRNA splicing ligase